MDLEKLRVGTRLKFPFVPVVGHLCILPPKTAQAEDGRMIGCLGGWALNMLGVSRETLANSSTPKEAIDATFEEDTDFSEDFLDAVNKLNDSKRMQKGLKELMKEVESNQDLLEETFGEDVVSDLVDSVEGLLDQYQTVNNPAPRR